MTLEYWQAATAIDQVASAISVLEKALDNLWPRLPVEIVKRLETVRELEHFNGSLAKRLRDIAEDLQEEGDVGVAIENAEDATIYA